MLSKNILRKINNNVLLKVRMHIFYGKNVNNVQNLVIAEIFVLIFGDLVWDNLQTSRLKKLILKSMIIINSSFYAQSLFVEKCIHY